MDVRIGVTWSAKELEVDLDATDREGLVKQVEDALAGGKVLWLTDKKGRTIGVPVDKISYVEVGAAAEDRKVGFGLG